MKFPLIPLLWIAALAVPAGALAAASEAAIEEEDAQSFPTEEEIAAWYPRTATSDKGTAVIYAPQIESWANFDELKGRLAFRISLADSESSYHGTLEFSSRTSTDLTTREVLLYYTEVENISIAGLGDDSAEVTTVREALQARSRRVPLDLVLAHLDRDTVPPNTEGLSHFLQRRTRTAVCR